MAELSIHPLRATDAAELRTLAHTIWHAHYPAMISRAQIDHMLDQRFHAEALVEALASGHWDGAWLEYELKGFAQTFDAVRELKGFAHSFAEDGETWKLDKLYVHPGMQRRGTGQALVQAVAGRARAAGATRLVLRVNRNNSQALAAYAKYGFTIQGEDVLDVGNGFVMDDYLLELKLCP